MERIYVIEDDENIRNLLKVALEGFGYEAECFETAEEGLKRIEELVPDLAIFDWMLPGDGWRNRHPGKSVKERKRPYSGYPADC